MRKLNIPALVGTNVAVYRDVEWGEYVVKVQGHGPEAWHHDSDRQAAIDTAVVMAAKSVGTNVSAH